MANMSYCRFQNTLADLRDCYDHAHEFDLEGDDGLSEDERHAFISLVKLCKRIAVDYIDDVED